MMLWVSYLRVCHPDLYQQYRAEEEQADAAPKGERFIAHMAVSNRWARKVNEMLNGGGA